VPGAGERSQTEAGGIDTEKGGYGGKGKQAVFIYTWNDWSGRDGKSG